MSGNFPELKSLEANVTIELDLSNYVTKADLKNATGVVTSSFTKNSDLVILKSEINKLDIGKLKANPVDLSKLNDAVKMKLLKRLYMKN